MRVVSCGLREGAVMHVLAGEVVGVFAHVERADQHGAGRFQPLDQRCVARRRRIGAVDLGAGDGCNAGDVEQVLDREGHAGERALVGRGVNRLRLGARALRRHGGEGVELGIERFDARKRRVDHRGGAGLAGRNGLRRSRRRFALLNRPPPDQASNTGAGSASSGSLNSSTVAAWRSVTSRLAFTAGCQASSSGRPRAAAAAR